MSSLQKSVLRARLPPTGMTKPPRDGEVKRGRHKDYTPTQWDQYFVERKDVDLNETTKFRIYYSRPPTEPGPLLLLLHGGGFSALTWSHFSTEITALVHCQCLAIDLRGHGDTTTDNETDLSGDTLANDVANVIAKLYPEDAPPIVIVGHSMGGAISVHIAYKRLIPTLIGVTVIDVVEGTAMEALASMQSFLRSRPSSFKSIPQAIEWSIRSGQIRNVESARVSMPGQIVNSITGKLATNELPLEPQSETDSGAASDTSSLNSMIIREEDEQSDAEPAPKFKPPPDLNAPKYFWRIDLSKSEVFWNGWFQGLSQKFLDIEIPKLLLLASIDGLDRTLTVGQMQGKFQMQVLARCGHAVHEDRPHEVAEVIGSFILRNKFSTACSDFVRQMPAC